MTVENVLGDRVRRLREHKGWNQSKLALMAGVSQSHISDIEQGNKGAKDAVLIKLANALDTTTDYLLGRTDDPSPRREEGGLGFDPDKLPPHVKAIWTQFRPIFRGGEKLTEEDAELIARIIEKLRRE